MEQLSKCWRGIALAVLIAASGGVALAQNRTPNSDNQRQLEKLMEDFVKSIPDSTTDQPPRENSGELQDLLKGMSSTGEESMPLACLQPLLAPALDQKSTAATPEDQEKTNELQGHFLSLPQLMLTKQWDAIIDLTQTALDLEKEIKTWPLSAAREQFRAELWSGRGMAFLARIRGDRTENMEKAIEALKNALESYHRALKSSAVNRECTYMVANINANLGAAYGQRIRGEKAENLEFAIAAFEQALTALTPETTPQFWAATQNNLGSASMSRVRGKRAENIEQGIKAYNAALRVWTRQDLPAAWASVQHNLAVTYLQRVRGRQADNIERAIEAATNSLAIRSREFPSGEKPVQIGAGDLKDALTEALASKGSTVYVTLKPDGWARSQSTLGKAYFKRINGDRADNIEHAIASYEAALTLWTLDTYPVERATVQTDLGEALIQRQRGERKENLDRAVSVFHAALEVYTSQAFPRDNLSTARLLGQALIAKGDWRHALEAFDVARTSFRLLFGQGLNEAEARDVLQEAGPLFTEAAYATAQLGDGKGALARLEEGKARLLGVALKLEGLDLSATQRRRVDELRVQIREGEAAYEAARGEEKAAKIAAVGRLRAELLNLVDAADATSGREAERDVIALATRILPKRSALVAPIVADSGGKLILVVRNDSGANLAVIAVPSLTSRRLGEVLGARDQGGWLGAYNINYLDRPEQARRHREWLGGIEKVGAELGALVEQPLIKALAANGLPPGSGAPITILPVGALGLLPLGLAQNPETHRYLIEDYTVTLAPSLQALASARARASAVIGKPTLAAIVNPTKDLPFTAVEGALVESRFAPDRRLAVAETAATRQAVLAALKGRDYWHFSSHGYFDWDEPRASGLLLTNRKPLTVGDLLDARDLGAPRLAVLSACETGLYDIATTPNEFIGLPAAFLQLGAGGVLATLWPVSDLSTGLLMAKFYDFHQGEGLAPASALRKSQNWLRTATSEDVENYLRAAAASGRLSKELAASLDMTKRTVPSGQSATSTARTAANVGQSPASVKRDMPFAHPYYWGGFTLTGL